MKHKRNLAELTYDISNNLLDSIRLTDILEDQIDGEAKSDTILRLIRNKIKSAFFNIEKCRKIISIVD